ncbi:MAG: hypothetical protein RIC87_21080 [Kiloniellales bacterium]
MASRRTLLIAGFASLLPLQSQAVGFQPSERDFLGPFYVAGADSDPILNRAGKPGVPVTLTGRIRSAGSGQAISAALVEIWQADGEGRYHPSGSGKASDYPAGTLALRGRLFTDTAGTFGVTTVVPGLYRPRPRHWHLKLSAAGHRTLVTQLYITGDNSRGRQPGAPDRHAPLVQRADGLDYSAPDIFLAPA